MGISEVRLRDAILRAANSGELFNRALETGRSAWEDTSALTAEASKRYETMKSKLAILRNNVIDLGISFYEGIQEPLKRAVSSALNSVQTLSRSIENGGLRDAVSGVGQALEGFVSTAAKLATTVLPPLISAVGLLGKNIDVVIPTVLSFTAAMKGLKAVSAISKIASGFSFLGGAASAAGGAASTASGAIAAISGISSVALPAALAVAGVVAAFVGLKKAMSNVNTEERLLEENYRKTGKAIAEQKKSYSEYKKSKADSVNVSLIEIESAQKLADELFRLVDANGRVTDANAGRANFILGQLNEAYGTNYSLVDGMIVKNGEEQVSVDELKTSVQELIAAKRFEVLSEAAADTYKTAKEEETKAIQNELEAYNELKEAEDQYGAYKGIYYKDMISKLQKAYDDAKDIRQGYTDDINAYENGYALAQEGRYQEAEERFLQMNKNYASAADAVEQYGKGSQEALNAYATNAEISLLAVKNALENYIKTGSEEAKQSLISSVNDAETKLQELANAGGDFSKEFSDSISGTKIDLTGLFNDISGQVQQNGVEIAASVPEIFSASFLQNTGVMETAACDTSTATIETGQKTMEAGSPAIGQAMDSGVAAGILGNLPLVTSASSHMAQLALDVARRTIDSHSPSKKFRDKVGKTIPEGVAVGINQNAGEVSDAVKAMFEDLDLQKELSVISEAEYYDKLRQYRDEYITQSSKEWWDYTKQLLSYEEKRVDQQFKNLSWLHEKGILSESHYYQMLAYLRDEYFDEGTEEWQEYTDAIVDHNMEAVTKLRDGIKEALEDARKEYADTVASGKETLMKFPPAMLKIEATDAEGNKREYYRANDYSYPYDDQFFQTIMNLQGLLGYVIDNPNHPDRDTAIKIYSDLLAMEPAEAMEQAKVYLNMSLDDFLQYLSKTTEVWAEDERRSDLIYGFVPGLKLEEEEKEWEDFKQKWYEAFGSLPDESYKIGSDMVKRMVQGALGQIDQYKAVMAEGMLSLFHSPALAAEGGEYSVTAGNTYNFYSSKSTVTEQLAAAKNQDTLKRMRGV